VHFKVEESFCTDAIDKIEDIGISNNEFEENLDELIDNYDPLQIDVNTKQEENYTNESGKKTKPRKYPKKIMHLNPDLSGYEKLYDNIISSHNETKPFKCSICGKEFKEIQNIKRHLIRNHYSGTKNRGMGRPKKLERETKVFMCEICSYKTNRKPTLRRHIRTVHFDVSGFKKCDQCKALIEEAKFKEHTCTRLTCEICGKEFGNQHLLNLHVKYNHEQKKEYLACETCGKLVLNNSMKDHVLLHHSNQKIPCPKCGIEIRSELGLRKHLKSHNVEKTLCPICNKEVKNMKAHVLKLHTREEDKKLQCTTCGKGFTCESSLKSHEMSVHIKARPYKCRYGCEFAYNDSSNRNAHERKTHGKLFDVKVR